MMKNAENASNQYLLVFNLPLILPHLFTFVIITTHANTNHYLQQDAINIDCGSSGNNTALDLRSWSGDINSTYFPLHGQNKDSISLEAFEPLMEADSVPYKTARLSHSEFTYMIPVSAPGPKFIRLYFYSATYEDFNVSKAFFSVKAGQFSLLRNFSVLLASDALGTKDMEKEFYVPIQDSLLNVTFTPVSSVSGTFALVNGIEVVSSPAELYFTDPEDKKHGHIFVGQKVEYFLRNDTAMETMYRINIGGKAVSPVEDSGMYRKWDQDDDYLTVPGLSVLPVITDINGLDFRENISLYAAPVSVYQTARSMGNNPDKALIRGYKLTWEFPVDSGFTYMLRLHFCEIESLVSRPGDRVFHIFIANETAETDFDVIGSSGGQYVPYFRDYVVLTVLRRGGKKVNLSVALQPNQVDANSAYVDAILNGVEIFKLNHSDGNLAGRKPDPTSPRTSQIEPTRPMERKNERTSTIIAINAGVISGMIILCILVYFFFPWPWRTVKDLLSSDGTSSNWWAFFRFSTTKSTQSTTSSTLPLELCRYFSLVEVRAATNNFDDNFVIGVGGFGNVYKGLIDSGGVATSVAIKRLKPQSSQGAQEFKTEIEMLSQLRHLNLVSLLGYCDEQGEMILVYEYMSHGTLSSHLYNTDNPPLSWKQRLKICIEVASGLHYLHTGVKQIIIHRDVKTTNILLDERLVAKVSDFGLSKIGANTLSKTHISTMVKGSFGYLDPEYFRRQQLTEKSDVYSLGVVLCEVLCGRPPLMRTVEKKQMNLAEWVRSCHQEKKLHQIVDPFLTGKIAPNCLKKFSEIAVSCILDNGAERPSMKEVLRDLEFAMQLQNNEEENIRLGGEPTEMSEDGSIRFHLSWEDESGSVFSDIKGLQGR